MENRELIQLINDGFDTGLPYNTGHNELLEKLAAHINHLILHDFPRLVQLLYRIDINETQLKKLLQQNPAEDAGKIIAALVIERQLQKIKTRKQFGGNNQSDDDEEKW